MVCDCCESPLRKGLAFLGGPYKLKGIIMATAQRTINGLTYDIRSPSHWQLKGFPVELAFLGDVWVLFLDYHGDIKTGRFASLQDGLELIHKALHPNVKA